MTMLRLTDAGRAALADGNNRAVNNVQLRALAIGSGTGPGGAGDDARVALRSQEAREDLTGTAAVAGRLAVRATFNPAGVYSVTEAGIIARIGDGGQEFLLAYWAVPSAANALATTVSGVALIVAGVIDITRASAEVNVNIAADVTFGGPGTLVALSDVPDVFSAGLYLRANNTATAGVWGEAPPVVADEDALPQPAAAVNSVYLVQDYDNTNRPVIAQLAGGAWHYTPTREWVRAQLNALVDGAPGALDTLNELAAALEDNADIVAALRGAIASRLTQAQVDERIRAVGGGVGIVAFFSTTEDVTAPINGANVISGDYTPSDGTQPLLALVSARWNFARWKLTVGGVDRTPVVSLALGALWRRQLFVLPAPGAGPKTYAIFAQHNNPNSIDAQRFYAGSSLTLLSLGSAVAQRISQDVAIDNTSWTRVLTLRVNTKAATDKVYLRLAILASAISRGNTMRLRLVRDTQTLVTVEDGAVLVDSTIEPNYPRNFEDWLDAPGQRGVVQYHVECRTSLGAGTVYAGSGVVAQRV